MDVEEGVAGEQDEVEDHPEEPQARRSPTPPASLPIFPLPRRPDAPSKSTLALQGLDQALVEAELVDPLKTVPLVQKGDEEQQFGLSSKMSQRLNDLGIDELFAGTLVAASAVAFHANFAQFTVQTAVVPFLLSDPKQRGLYLPYNPPRDVCVSAPTGSGKTLAYVVPIVEACAIAL